MQLLGPFLRDLHGRYVLTNKGKLARHLQESCGDLLFNDRDGRIWGVECKAEETYYGNLFLETWSNRNLRNAHSHADRGSNPGWLLKTRADLLFYHILERDELWIIHMLSLKRWAFVMRSEHRSPRASGCAPERMAGRVWDFPIREQRKRRQRNDTWGRCVPIEVLKDELPVSPHRESSVEQLAMKLRAKPL